jgi:hypothetical protein
MIKMYRTIIFLFCYGYEILPLTLREEHIVFENTVPRRKFGPRKEEVTGVGENCIIRSFIIYTLPKILLW